MFNSAPGAWWRGAALVLLTLAVYLPSYRGEALWDDAELVFENALVHRPDGLAKLWASTLQPDYYPITWTSFWIEWRLWGDNPTGYRATNVALHALAALLLWRLLLRLQVPGAWLAAAIFAVHPVCVASAAWISQRKNTLSMVFYLVSLLAFVRFDDSRRWTWYMVALLAFVAAMLSKVSVVALPVVMIGIAWARHRRLTRSDWAAAAPFFAVGIVLAVIGMWFQTANAIGADDVRPEGLASRILGSGWVYWFYLIKAIFPANLSMVYPRWNIDPAQPLHYLPLGALIATLAICWLRRRRWGPAPFLALAYCLVTLAPVLGILSMAYAKISLVSDHLQYIAIPGIATLVAYGAARGAQRASESQRQTATIGAGMILTVLAALTWMRAGVFAVHERLWRDAIARHPDAWIARHDLAALLLRKHRTAQGAAAAAMLHEAEGLMREVVAVRPNFAPAHGNLGVLLIESGRVDDGIASLHEALRVNPKHTPSNIALGEVARQRGDHREAAAQFQHVAEAQPFDAMIRLRWGAELVADGRAAEAAVVLHEAVALDPAAAALHYNFGYALDLAGDAPTAEREYRETLRIKPDDADALNRLAALLATKPGADAAQVGQALDMSRRAVELTKRENAEILYDYACLLGLAGLAAESLTAAREALTVARRTNDATQIQRILTELPELANTQTQATSGPAGAEKP